MLFLFVLLVGIAACEQRRVPAPRSATAVQSVAERTPEPAAPVSTVPQNAAAPFAIENRHGLRGLLAALDDVTHVELVRWNPSAPAQALATQERKHVLSLLREGRLTDAHTVTSPPWEAVLLFHTRRGRYAVTLVGHSQVRLHPGSTGVFAADAAQWNHSPPPELVLNDGEDWLWRYLESQLGPTQNKEYLAPERAPDYLEHPDPPSGLGHHGSTAWLW